MESECSLLVQQYSTEIEYNMDGSRSHSTSDSENDEPQMDENQESGSSGMEHSVEQEPPPQIPGRSARATRRTVSSWNTTPSALRYSVHSEQKTYKGACTGAKLCFRNVQRAPSPNHFPVNKTWVLVTRPSSRNIISCKWL